MTLLPFSQERLQRIKTAYTPRKVKLEAATHLLNGINVAPRAGDLVLATVNKIGQHSGLELTNGRRAALFAGDEIVVCYGHRYAPDQFEAEMPIDLTPCHLVASGGIAARALSWHSKMKTPTAITPLGLLSNRNGQRINLSSAALEKPAHRWPLPYTVAVVGTAMNAGKTTTAAHLVRGLTDAGFKVGAAKVTGTGSGRDSWLMGDAGARVVVDFTDAGFPSTFRCTPGEVETIFTTLTHHLAKTGMDVIVLEVADGLYQTETAALLASPCFGKTVDSIIFAAGDAMGATAGVTWLRHKNLPVTAVSGLLTASPLASAEAAAATGLPVFDKKTLHNPRIAAELGLYSKVEKSA